MFKNTILPVEILVVVEVHDAWLIKMLMNIYDIIYVGSISTSDNSLAWSHRLSWV